MKHLKKLSRKQKVILSSLRLDPNNYLRLTQNWESFTVVNIKNKKVLEPIRY